MDLLLVRPHRGRNGKPSVGETASPCGHGVQVWWNRFLGLSAVISHSPCQFTPTNLSLSPKAQFNMSDAKKRKCSFMVLRGKIKTISWVEVSLGILFSWRMVFMTAVCKELLLDYSFWILKTPSLLHWGEPAGSITHRSLLWRSLGCVTKVFRAGGTLIFIRFETVNQSDLTTVKYNKSTSFTKMCSCFLVTFSKDSAIIILCWFPQTSLDKGWPTAFQKHWLRKVWSAKRN